MLPLRLSKLPRHVQSLLPANPFQLLILCTHAPTVLMHVPESYIGSEPSDDRAIPTTSEGYYIPASVAPRGDSRDDVPSRQSQRSEEIQSSMAVDGMDMDGSGNDTGNSEPGRSSKKKKGQRFFCTEFPPCNLSFTRSEHLARHIRFILTLVVESLCFC